MTNPIPWQRLKELAERATPGPYSALVGMAGRPSINSPAGSFAQMSVRATASYVAAASRSKQQADADAMYVAALDPATVLQMVAEHAAVREALVDAEHDLEMLARPREPSTLVATLRLFSKDCGPDTKSAIAGRNMQRRGLCEQAADEIDAITKRAEVAEAKLDALMLEFCPGEMTEEQKERWARHQQRATPEQEAAVRAALTGGEP